MKLGRRKPRSSWLLVALLTAVLVICGCGADSPQARSDGLRWPPPALSAPTTIHLGNGYTDTDLDPTRDYVIDLGDREKLGGVTLEGGHNLVLIGGHITVPAAQPPGPKNDRFRTGLYIKGATGTVHVEGVRFGGAPGAVWDAVDINAPAAVVQLENIRVEGLRGRFNGFHADAVQPWGGVRKLRIDRLTATSNYQGVTIPIDEGPIGEADLRRIDLRGLSAHAEKGGHLLWLTTGSETCRSYPVRLNHVYVQPRSGLSLGESVWPQRGRPRRCGARVKNRHASWPRLPLVKGHVSIGTPPGEEYVPVGVAGPDYVSPGYRRLAG